MPLHVVGPVLEVLSAVGDALLFVKALFSRKERARLRALGRGQLAAAIFLGIAAWALLLFVLGYTVAVVLTAS
jgi:hypothetical protein